jgi:hypothetical protein
MMGMWWNFMRYFRRVLQCLMEIMKEATTVGTEGGSVQQTRARGWMNDLGCLDGWLHVTGILMSRFGYRRW